MKGKPGEWFGSPKTSKVQTNYLYHFGLNVHENPAYDRASFRKSRASHVIRQDSTRVEATGLRGDGAVCFDRQSLLRQDYGYSTQGHRYAPREIAIN
ncbi:hypothetical protein LTR22_022934 [Elasticomyces elasticus]|nr:hypothetical protein LTR22_022934 [Elasticomyces elasticus]